MGKKLPSGSPIWSARFEVVERTVITGSQATSMLEAKGYSLQVPRLCGLRPPAVVPPVEKLDRHLQEFFRRRIVERAHLHRDIVSTDLLDVAAAERANAAVFAERVMCTLCSKLIVAQIGLARKQAEISGLDSGAPVPRLRTD
jgi:hypothetical protein